MIHKIDDLENSELDLDDVQNLIIIFRYLYKIQIIIYTKKKLMMKSLNK